MVGDFISVVPNNTPIQVAAIHRKKIGYHERNDKLSWARIGLVRRIPLTREILEKNGFDCGDCYAYLRLNSDSWLQYYYFENRIRKFWAGIDEWQNHSEVTDITFQCHCRYVHELQHALKLCGINKEIKL